MKRSLIHICLLTGLGTMFSYGQSFYKQDPLFSTAPFAEKSVNHMPRFGPVGMEIELHQPAFTMVAGDIEPGSPAEIAGLKKGQTITAINGQVLKDIDPRIQLGQMLSAAEASDGVLRFTIKDQPKEIVVKVPVMGAYSDTWPLNCPKSDKIVRGFADYISKPDANKGFAGAGMLFLLSTGEEKDLLPVKQWVHSLDAKKTTGYAWHIGFAGIPLCEYYLRTGDPIAIPVIQNWVEAAQKGEYLDAWAGRGGVVKLGYGNGHLNAGGTAVVTFLMLAKQCGAEIDDSLLHRTLIHFFRFAGRGITPYGDDRPETSYVDNGKHGNLAFAMAAAASLTPEGENSIYAKARDICAMTSFYTTTFMLHGHTGGGIGEIWRSSAMTLLADKKPKQVRDFLANRQWHYDLSRRYDGSFGIFGGEAYDTLEWGALYPWVYTFPRKKLRITGAPPSKFSKQYQLPQRPWGVEADDVFLSMSSIPAKDGSTLDLSNETIHQHSAKPFILALNAKEISDEEFRVHIRHPEFLNRFMIANMVSGLTADYMVPKPKAKARTDLLEEFSRHSDPRIRYAGLRASHRIFDPSTPASQKIFSYAIERLKDNAESWFVKDVCLAIVAKGTPDMIIAHVDLLIHYLSHPEQWLQNSALTGLVVISADPRTYDKVLPILGDFFRKTPRQSTTIGSHYAIRSSLATASPAIQKKAVESLGSSYAGYQGSQKWQGGQDMSGHRKDTMEMIAETLSSVPGGYDLLFEIAKKQQPDQPLPHEKIFLAANSDAFGPTLKNSLKPIIREKLIYQYIANHRQSIFNDIKKPQQRGVVTNSIDGLISLYQKVGIRDYDWQEFGNLSKAKWNYHSFEPIEKQAYDKSPWRYRPVSVPLGMEQWYMPEFNAAKAKWKQGEMPFGQFQGALDTNKSRSTRDDNHWIHTPKTLWENEVLLVQQTFQLPVLKSGYSYRMRVDRGQGVGAGDGFKIYLNGKNLVESKEGLGRRGGNTIRGAWITEEFTNEFAAGPVTISAITFLRYGDRAIVQMPPVPQGIFSMWLEERKLPPLDADALQKAAKYTPLMSSTWQARHNPNPASSEPDDNPFDYYDGTFQDDPALHGTWALVDVVKSIDAFVPTSAKSNAGKPPFNKITIASNGSTDTTRFYWSGDTLMDIDLRSALKMTTKSIAGAKYLFVESGGFSEKNPIGWKTTYTVLKQ